MIKHIQKRNNPYVQIDKQVIGDKRLSWRARGLLVYLLSKPPDWSISMQHLFFESNEGRRAVQKTMQELQRFGYAKLEPTSKGKEWTVFEEPQVVVNQPQTKKPSVGFCTVQKCTTTNNDKSTKNDKTKNEKKEEGSLSEPEEPELSKEDFDEIMGNLSKTLSGEPVELETASYSNYND